MSVFRTLAIIAISFGLSLPALSNEHDKIVASKVTNWLTLNDEKVCAAQVFYTNEITLVELREKSTGTYAFLMQDRDPARNIEGLTVTIKLGNLVIGTETFNDSETIGFEMTDTIRQAWRDTKWLTMEGEGKVLLYEMTGSALADIWVQECDRDPPTGTDPILVPQRPLDQKPENPEVGLPLPSNGASTQPVQNGASVTTRFRSLIPR